MNDENVDPSDTPSTPDPAQPTFDSAAVDRARDAIRDVIGTPTSVPEAVSGAMIGRRYKLLELIGEGGMGVVWMAEQRSPVKRLVAVKLIKAGMDSSAVLARFEAERQALAMMDHPNIARVFDGGTTDRGHPYFIMELVKGLPLTKYCDQRRMSVHERLDLFVEVCAAVQHAHQKGIIHRDLKPANLLVTEHDGKPVPKVIDFGLAKALGGSSVLTDHTLHTAFGAAAGTPHYMAPEQVAINALDVDTRADIYALGVILYELLTGSTPHELKQLNQAAWDEIRRVIGHVEPPRPSLRITQSATLVNLAASRHTEPARLSKLVAGELDWIVMKALEKDRHRRYGTASDLAADLQRHLAGEPVLAAPPTVIYRMRKVFRKHRFALSTAAAILIVLIAGVLASTWQAVRASRAERIARSETVEAENQKTEAQRQKSETQKQRDVALKASAEAATDMVTIHRQLADSYVEAGVAAWKDQNPELAALWFVQAWKLDQGDPRRERADKIRVNDSFNRSPRLLDAICPHRLLIDTDSQPGLPWIVDEADGRVVVAGGSDLSKSLSNQINLASITDDQAGVVAINSGVAQAWDITTGHPLGPAVGTKNESRDGSTDSDRVILTPDRKHLITLVSGSIHIWDVATGTATASAFTGKYNCVDLSKDGKWLATVNTDNQVEKCELSGTRIQKFVPPQSDGDIISIQFSTDAQNLIATTNNSILSLHLADSRWNTVSGRFAAFSPDGHWIAGGQPFQLINASTGDGRTFEEGITCTKPPVFSPDGTKLLLIDEPGGLTRAYSIPSGRPLTPTIHYGKSPHSPEFTADSRGIVTHTGQQVVRIWDATGSPLFGSQNFSLRSTIRPDCVIFTTDGSKILFETSSDNENESSQNFPLTFRSLDPVTGESQFPPILTYFNPWRDHYVLERPYFPSRPQKWIARMVDAQHVRIWDTQSGLPGTTITDLAWAGKEDDGKGLIHFSPDGRLVFHAGGRYDGNGFSGKFVGVWDTATGRRIDIPPSNPAIPDGVTRDLKFLPNGVFLLHDQTAGTVSNLGVWNLLTGKQVGRPISTDAGYTYAELSPDAQRVVFLNDDHFLHAWDVNTAQPCEVPADAHSYFMHAYAPDGQTYVQGHRIFDAVTHKAITPPLEGFTDNFSYADTADLLVSHGEWEASVAAEVWDSALTKPVTGPFNDEWFESINLSPTGDRLVTANINSVKSYNIRATDLSLADAQAMAEALSCERVDDVGGLVSLTQSDYAGRWNALHSALPGRFSGTVPTEPPNDVSPTYRHNIETRLATATTDEAKHDLAREWCLAGEQENCIGFYREAALLEQTALSLDNALLAARDHLARAYVGLGRFDDALSIYQSNVGQDYQTPGPWHESGTVGSEALADIIRRLPEGREGESLSEVIALVRPVANRKSLPPQNTGPTQEPDTIALCKLATARFSLGHVEEAKDILRKAIKVGSNADAQSNAGKALIAARTLIDPGSARQSDDFADGLSSAAWAVASKSGQPGEKYAQALDLASRSVAASINPYNLCTLGAARFRTGDYSGALEALARSQAIDYVEQENRAMDLIFSAMADKKLGRDAEAHALLQKVIDINNSDGLNDDGTSCLNEAAALIDPAATRPSTQPATEPADEVASDQGQSISPTSQPDLPQDVQTLGHLAIHEFKIGHIQEAKDVLREALKAGKDAADATDDGQLLYSARSLIDPPSTQPVDPFADGLDTAAWAIVSKPNQTPQKYAEALILAQQSLAAHSDANGLNTLGVAQFRTGDYSVALATFAHSDAVDFVSEDAHLSNLAFSAMAQHKLGRHAEAKLTLQKANEFAKDSAPLDADDTRALNEASTLIDPASTRPATQPTTAP